MQTSGLDSAKWGKGERKNWIGFWSFWNLDDFSICLYFSMLRGVFGVFTIFLLKTYFF